MLKSKIPLENIPQISTLIKDYLREDVDLKSFYGRFPNLENFKTQIQDKKQSLQVKDRVVLTKVLLKQYENTTPSILTQQNIEALKTANTFTVTTGHQLNIFTGPLYFIYKIIGTINTCIALKKAYPEYNFVPIYWMATEDHDFEEINHFNFKGKKVQWHKESTGAVGPIGLEGLEKVFKVFSLQLGNSVNEDELRQLFKKSYLEHQTLAEATRYLVSSLFGDYGLVILDANNSDLKQLFVPYIKDELLQQITYNTVIATSCKLEKKYKIQANPRDINLFYILNNIRKRIVKKEKGYSVLGTEKSWKLSEILEEVENYPERFSPNVLMRPLYQEVVLPNLSYIGGAGELAYWLQLKATFDAFKIPYPILQLRPSALLITSKQRNKLLKLNLSIQDLFLKQPNLLAKTTESLSKTPLDFADMKKVLKQQFSSLYTLAKKTDNSFTGALSAQERKQTKGLEYLERRWLRAEKRRLKQTLTRVEDLQNDLFPSKNLQERQGNFSEFYIHRGSEFMPKLLESFKPFENHLFIIEY